MSNILIRTRDRLNIPGLVTRVFRTASGGLWFPEHDAVLDPKLNALALLRRVSGPQMGRAILIPGANIVTTAGNVHLAQKACGETPTNLFTYWEQASAGTPGVSATRAGFTAIGSSSAVQDATYPKTSDGDADNTGAGATVRTSRVSYSAGAFTHAAITHAYITNLALGASEPLFAGWAWASSINKTSADTLKCFHNATLLGV